MNLNLLMRGDMTNVLAALGQLKGQTDMTQVQTPSPSLYTELKAAGIPLDHHESDLYFLDTPEAREILARYPIKHLCATRFVSKAEPHKDEVWVDVPFAYEPFWEAKSKLARQVGGETPDEDDEPEGVRCRSCGRVSEDGSGLCDACDN